MLQALRRDAQHGNLKTGFHTLYLLPHIITGGLIILAGLISWEISISSTRNDVTRITWTTFSAGFALQTRYQGIDFLNMSSCLNLPCQRSKLICFYENALRLLLNRDHKQTFNKKAQVTWECIFFLSLCSSGSRCKLLFWGVGQTN